MQARQSAGHRAEAVERARYYSPFLRAAMDARPEILETFVRSGSGAAIGLSLSVQEEAVDARLRRQRQGLALAIALGDLAGELSFEQVTAHLSDFADAALDEAVRTAISERVPDAE